MNSDFFFTFYVCLEGIHVEVTGPLVEFDSFLHLMGFGNQTQILKPCGRPLYPLLHLAAPW